MPSQSVLAFLGHKDIFEIEWRDLDKDDDHPIIYSERGSHTSNAKGARVGIKQETWTSGSVYWPDSHVSASGGIVNVGARKAAMNGQLFIYYSGLWGSPSEFASVGNLVPTSSQPVHDLLQKLIYVSSGYWGPAFNETGEGVGGLIRAWCYDMRDQDRSECYTS
jgi:hypothetical protein